MKDLALTFIPPFKAFVWKIRAYAEKRDAFQKDADSSKFLDDDLRVLNFFRKRINEIFLSKENISVKIDNTMSWFKHYIINRVDLTDDKNQLLVFEQLKEFLNYFWFVLRKNSKYLFNSLSSNKIESFSKKSIWNKIDNLVPKGDYLSDPNYCSSCRHYALLFKDFFDQLESIGLNVTSYIFVEKTDSADQDHLWLIVTFQWENFLVDAFSDVEKKVTMQSINNLPKIFFERMESLSRISRDDIIYDDVFPVINDYLKSNELYHKVLLKTDSDLFELLSSILNKKWCLCLSRLAKRNLLDLLMWTFFNFFEDKISFAHTFDYYFDKKFDEKRLETISDEDLLKEMVNHISYKKEKGKNTVIKVFDFEKKHLLSRLSYFADRIDYSHLRKILAGSQTKSDE